MEESEPPKRKGRPTPRSKPTPKLRDFPANQSLFLHDSLSDYLAQKLYDKTHDSTNDRWLPPNEIDAMALNDIAVSRGQGFFFFLPTRNSWSRQTYDPESRGPLSDSIGASIPSLIFMRFTWSKRGQDTYFQSPHRLRYLACDFQVNPPPHPTPVYCIQAASDARYPLFMTPHTSFIMLRTNPLYFGSVADMAPIIGPPPRRRKGPDAELRLAQASYLWDKQSTNPQVLRFKRFSHSSLESLYEAVLNVCHSPASLTSGNLLDLLPRPAHPEVGIAIGTSPSVAPSRVGIRLARTSPERD